MTNVQLLVVAVVAIGGAMWWSATHSSAAWAPTVLSMIMLVMAVGGPIWEWSKWSGGSGLTPTVRAASFGESAAAPAFLWASVGAGLSAFLIPLATASIRENKKRMETRNISIVVIFAAAISFVGYAIGNGPSFLNRDVYGKLYVGSDGNAFLLRTFWPMGVIIGLIALAMLAVEKDRKPRLGLIAMSILWFIGSAADGSRTSIAFPVLAAVLIVRSEISQRRLHPLMIVSVLALLGVTVLTFAVSFQSRSMPLGLLNLPNVVAVTIGDTLNSTDSYLLPLKQLASSVFVSFPVTEKSAAYGVGVDVLVANANPLPGTSQAMELERYWPYEWVPLSFAGTWFGATGWLGQSLLYCGIGWMSGYTAYNLQRSRYHVLSFVPVYIAALIGLVSAQYPSRMGWRLISIGLALLVASYMFRRTRKAAGLDAPAQVVSDEGQRGAHALA